MMTPRELFLQIHLWLGLATGLVVAVVCFTGAVLAFEHEIEEALHPERYHVEAVGQPLPLDEVVARVRAARPDVEVGGVTVTPDPTRSLELTAGRGHSLFADPYTGEVLGEFVYSETFFFTMFALHRWLLVRDPGRLIVGISTLLFLVVLVTGVVTWWPKNGRQLRDRLRVTGRAGWKRLNFDLHVSLGIYAAVFLFIMAFTGLAWSFEWFNDGIYWVTGSSQERPEAPTVEYRPEAEPLPLDRAYQTAVAELPPSASYSIGLPRDSVSALSVRALPLDAAHERAYDQIQLDPVTGEVLAVQPYAERTLGSRTRSAFYAWHVGSMFGWPSRVVFFVACVLGATFPITGALVWVNKRSKRWRRRWRERSARRQETARI